MRFSATLMIGLLAAPLMAWSQATSSLIIPVNNQTVKRGAEFATIDLLKETRKLKSALNNISNIEIQMVRFEAKSTIGGGQIFLRINSDLVASAVIETNPDNFNSEDSRSYERFELKNIDRSRISEASLQIQNFQNLRLKNVEVIFGSVQEPVVFGRYADQQAQMIGGAVSENSDTRPSSTALSKIYASYYGTSATPIGAAVVRRSKTEVVQPINDRQQVSSARLSVESPSSRPVAINQPTKTKSKSAINSRCIQNSMGRTYCIGDMVKNAWGFEQKIISVNARRGEVTLISELYAEPYIRSVDMLSK